MAIVKAVSFKDEEQDLINFIGKRAFSYYVKELIRKDMEGNYIQPKKEEERYKPRRNTNFDI